MFTLGLDGLDITINTDVKLEQNHYAFKNQAGKELGNLAAVKNGYKLHLCLPKMIRNNNSIPFGVSDYKQLKNVLEFIKNNVLNLFKGESTEITVQACEVNSTVVLSRKEQTAPMLKLLSHVLLIKDEKLFIACSGEQIGKRYKAVKNLCSGQRIESIKTGQLSNLRFCFKIYDKAIEQNITDKGLLRIEFCYSVRGLKYAKVGRTLETFLTPDSINALGGIFMTYMTYAERAYYSRNKKQVESTEDYLNRVTQAYNEIYSLINKVNDSKGCIQASNEINAFRQIVGKNATDVLKLRKQLINRIETLLEDNDTKIQDLKQEIEDIQSFDVSDTMEEATKLDRLATNRMYELMVSFNGNSNSTKRKLGNLVLNKNGLDRISATALSRLCAIPAYADFFKPSYKEIIAEAMKSDAQKTYERNSQPVIEEKNRAIGKTYMSNFLLRKALSMANTAVSSDEVASNE